MANQDSVNRGKDRTIEVALDLPSDTSVLALVGKINEAMLDELRARSDEQVVPERIEVALSEAVSNAILHGNENIPNAYIKLWFTLNLSTGCLTVKVFDLGPGFEVDSIPAPVAEGFHEGGRGVFLIRKIMDHVESYTTPEGHYFVMSKTFRINASVTAD